MLNNKGYGFTLIILFSIIVITLAVFLFKLKIYRILSQDFYIYGEIKKCYHEYYKYVFQRQNWEKQIIYSNISNYSLVSQFNDSIGGIITSNYFKVPFYIDDYFCRKDKVNISFKGEWTNLSINYPISDLLNAEEKFDPARVQGCIKNCDYTNYDTLVVSCLYEIDGYKLVNTSFPVLVGNRIYVDLALQKDGTTLLYPFYLGTYEFLCS